ncbi:Sds3-like-domain-containing protein [Lophiotrema nucula]|uniref:Sds3-like-domain-containing protein n=1 Tax=Lophiotrema nucula TaxID=690887 RepID=A0A6A5YKB9_9PLEO|nr:Sds3-like-domain-containing protein [Lophiotrema nucula]
MASASDAVLLASIAVPTLLEPAAPVAVPLEPAEGGLDDLPDNGSSSLSELGDASDDQSEPTPRPSVPPESVDGDSEAETERLEKTPRKLVRTATDTSIASEQLYQRTPSKLVYSRTLDEDDSAPLSPSATLEEAVVVDASDPNAALHSLSIVATSEAAGITETTGKKRKRSSEESSSIDEPADEPDRKRRGSVLNGSQEGVADRSTQADVEEELDHAEERIAELAQEDAELEQRQADVAAEAISELATVAKLTKPRKGGRKGKRKVDDTGDTPGEPVATIEANDGEAEGDHDEDDGGAHDEEAAKKKKAIDELSKIERKFKIFREKLCDEQIAQCEKELEMLKQPNCIHPEYLAMIQAVDERRNEKIAYERQLLQYKLKCRDIQTVAERHQIHSQYFQTVRDVRENILSECNQRVHELQKGRRQLGVEEVDYSIKLPEKRSEQIRQQSAYNLEVSILSGVAKYVGFPAAPDIKPARATDIDDDLRAMKITTRTVPVPVSAPVAYVRTVDEAAAEEQFIERTPWANPQHPAHQQSHYASGPGRIPSQTYQTPAGQRRAVDVHAPNGSASTIEVNSNPPSSAAATGYANATTGRIIDSESPVLQMKRNPSDLPPQSETPGSFYRNFSAHGRDPHTGNAHVLSSPAAGHVEPQFDEQRWRSNGIRPLNANSVPPTSSMPNGPDAARIPLGQRGSLGAVSVGSGNGLFGR